MYIVINSLIQTKELQALHQGKQTNSSSNQGMSCSNHGRSKPAAAVTRGGADQLAVAPAAKGEGRGSQDRFGSGKTGSI